MQTITPRTPLIRTVERNVANACSNSRATDVDETQDGHLGFGDTFILYETHFPQNIAFRNCPGIDRQKIFFFTDKQKNQRFDFENAPRKYWRVY